MTVEEFARANPGLILGVLASIMTVLTHYRKTGRIPLGRLPWRAMKMGARYVTTAYFTRSRPTDTPGILVETSPAALETTFRLRQYESGDLYSFEYDGEVLNLRKPTGYYTNPETEEDIASELHLRGFRTNDGPLFLLAHHEASRWEEWKAHITGTILSWQRGREKLITDLDAGGFEYELVEGEASAGLKVEE